MTISIGDFPRCCQTKFLVIAPGAGNNIIMNNIFAIEVFENDILFYQLVPVGAENNAKQILELS